MSDAAPRAPQRLRTLDIGIVTCRRPRGLRRLLEGLQLLEPPPGVELRVVVADNDPEGSARPVCDDARAWLELPLDYVLEKRRGIPQARNAVLARSLATADLVAFIDDDEVPDPRWLCELLEILHRERAQAVTGPTHPRFEREPARWIRDSRLFESLPHADGERLRSAYTHNVLVETGALATLDRLFDERMALIGGSDSELFERFGQAGHRIVWCDSARVDEWIPASRARLSWLLRRAFRVGASSAFIRRSREETPSRRAAAFVGDAGCVVQGAVQVALGLAFGRGFAARGAYLASYGVGRIAGGLGLTYAEYETVHGR